jgi:Na+/H+ antiporter NhaD/arsenite permease-like protein
VVWIAALFLLRFLFREELAQMPLDQDAIYSLDPNQALHDRKTAVRVLIVVLGAIIFFFLQGALRLTPSFVAMSAAAVALVWVRPGVEEVLKRVEWSVLSFFGALFVMVGGLEKAGALEVLVSLLEHVTWITPALFGVLIIWAVAILSSFVDNIPITIALIPVIQGLGVDGMNITPIWWALAFGAGFGGNGTIIGSSANIVVALLSEKTRTPITSAMWNKRGLPVMILACSVVSVLYVILFPWLS